MTDLLPPTPEGGGWTARCACSWESWHTSYLAADRATFSHAKKCKARDA